MVAVVGSVVMSAAIAEVVGGGGSAAVLLTLASVDVASLTVRVGVGVARSRAHDGQQREQHAHREGAAMEGEERRHGGRPKRAEEWLSWTTVPRLFFPVRVKSRDQSTPLLCIDDG